MALQQGLEAPEQLQDIFDTSDALWEAERVLQLALERVGRHVERLVVNEHENSAAVQSCLRLILAACDPQSLDEASNQLPLAFTDVQEESPGFRAARYTRGGIPIKTDTSDSSETRGDYLSRLIATGPDHYLQR